jgi:hypothetical protein
MNKKSKASQFAWTGADRNQHSAASFMQQMDHMVWCHSAEGGPVKTSDDSRKILGVRMPGGEDSLTGKGKGDSIPTLGNTTKGGYNTTNFELSHDGS